jgi:hypothetical protein
MTFDQALQLHRRADCDDFDPCTCYGITPKFLSEQMGPLTPGQTTLVEALDKGFSDIKPSDKEQIVYRAGPALFVNQLKARSGIYPAFIPTSRNLRETLAFLKDYADWGAALFRIVLPKGSTWVQAANDGITCLEPNEILLPRNCNFAATDWNPNDTLDEADLLTLQFASPAPTKFLQLDLLKP